MGGVTFGIMRAPRCYSHLDSHWLENVTTRTRCGRASGDFTDGQTDVTQHTSRNAAVVNGPQEGSEATKLVVARKACDDTLLCDVSTTFPTTRPVRLLLPVQNHTGWRDKHIRRNARVRCACVSGQVHGPRDGRGA